MLLKNFVWRNGLGPLPLLSPAALPPEGFEVAFPAEAPLFSFSLGDGLLMRKKLRSRLLTWPPEPPLEFLDGIFDVTGRGRERERYGTVGFRRKSQAICAMIFAPVAMRVKGS